MDEMASAQFRRQYAKLTKPTVVTVNGHPIGTWTPITGTWEAFTEKLTKQLETVRAKAPTAQAARDDLLRKINRGK